eukprot:7098903-Prymnesium_polylepis.1
MCVTTSPRLQLRPRETFGSYLHLGVPGLVSRVGARRRHELAAACRVFGARHVVDVRRGPRPDEDPLPLFTPIIADRFPWLVAQVTDLILS